MNKAVLLRLQQEELKTAQQLEMEHKSNQGHQNPSFEEEEEEKKKQEGHSTEENLSKLMQITYF